jgi:prefoldin subunit 5
MNDITGEGRLEAQVAKLEANVEHIQSDITDIKTDIRELRGDIKKLFEKLESAQIRALLLYIAQCSVLLGVMAKGFGWLK